MTTRQNLRPRKPGVGDDSGWSKSIATGSDARVDPTQLRFVAYGGCAALLFAQIAYNFVDIDLWHQINLIRASIAAGHLLTADPFAYVPTVHPMIDHEWGAGMLAFFLAKWLGGSALLFLKFVAAFATLILGMRLAERRGGSASVLVFLGPVYVLLLYLGFLSAVRAQAYSYFFTVCLLWVLESSRCGDHRWLWLGLVAFPVWVNLHAGFVAGIGLVLLFCIEQALMRAPLRHGLIALVMMTGEVFLNPYGLKYFSYLFRALRMSRPRIPEWSPLWTVGWSTTLLFALALALVSYILVRLRTLRVPGMLLLAACAVEAVLHRKMLPFLAIAWIAYVPALFETMPEAHWLQQFAKRRRVFICSVWVVVMVACAVSATREQFWKVQIPQVAGEPSYPVGAVDYIAAQGIRGNIFVPFRSGAYVSWKLYPNIKVSVDSRYEVAYPNDWVGRNVRFYEAREGWRETLIAYPTDLVLAPRDSTVLPLLHNLLWTPVYLDTQFEIDARPGLELSQVDARNRKFAGVFP